MSHVYLKDLGSSTYIFKLENGTKINMKMVNP